MWSADVDPCVLAVRAGQPAGKQERLFDLATTEARHLRGRNAEHLVIDRGSEVIRLDVIDGTVAAGPVSLQFDLLDDDRLDRQLSTIRALRAPAPVARRHVQLARRLLALHAIDARDAGASLREVADAVLGRGDWPGDGEHRKSLVRRMIATGDHMICAGSRGILAGA